MFPTLQCFFTSHNVGLHPSDLAFKCNNQGLLRLALKVLDFFVEAWKARDGQAGLSMFSQPDQRLLRRHQPMSQKGYSQSKK